MTRRQALAGPAADAERIAGILWLIFLLSNGFKIIARKR